MNHKLWEFEQLADAGRLLSQGMEVRSNPRSYDADLARQLWDASADVVKLSR